jgi:hypothetical protein
LPQLPTIAQVHRYAIRFMITPRHTILGKET